RPRNAGKARTSINALAATHICNRDRPHNRPARLVQFAWPRRHQHHTALRHNGPGCDARGSSENAFVKLVNQTVRPPIQPNHTQRHPPGPSAYCDETCLHNPSNLPTGTASIKRAEIRPDILPPHLTSIATLGILFLPTANVGQTQRNNPNGKPAKKIKDFYKVQSQWFAMRKPFKSVTYHKNH
ncbi:MAG: hypothetical protein RI953_996, partial [Pseudomonadota bacterium]